MRDEPTALHDDATPSARSNSSERATSPVPEAEWVTWPDEKLLDLRLCDLDLRIEGTLDTHIQQLYRELAERNVRFRPFFYLSDEWFTPDGVVGTAVPFYLAHPRLARLELTQMLEVEGGTPEWCMRNLAP
jgi:hypothetical protein